MVCDVTVSADEAVTSSFDAGLITSPIDACLPKSEALAQPVLLSDDQSSVEADGKSAPDAVENAVVDSASEPVVPSDDQNPSSE